MLVPVLAPVLVPVLVLLWLPLIAGSLRCVPSWTAKHGVGVKRYAAPISVCSRRMKHEDHLYGPFGSYLHHFKGRASELFACIQR